MCHKSQGPGLPNPRLSLESQVLWSHNLFPLVFHSEMILRGESSVSPGFLGWGLHPGIWGGKANRGEVLEVPTRWR